MLQPWLEAFPSTVQPLVDEVDSLLGYKLSEIITNGPNSLLTATIHSQPAIMASSIIILRVLEKEFGFHPPSRCDYTLGHSLGEFAAFVAAGHATFADSLYLVRRRAEVMAHCSKEAVKETGGEYGMMAIVTEPDHLAPLIKAIEEFTGHQTSTSTTDSSDDKPPIQQAVIANINSKNQIVLSGSIGMIRVLLTHLRSFGGHDPRAVRLKSDSPFHSPLMRPAQDEMKKLLNTKSRIKGHEEEDIVVWPGNGIEVVSNVTARPIRSKQEIKELWARQTTETVRWWDSIRYLDQECKVRRWVGVGPGKVGRNLVGKEVGMRGREGGVRGGGVWSISDPREVEEVLKGLEETEDMGDEEE